MRPKVAPGLSAKDIEFILNVSLPQASQSTEVSAFSASAPEFIPQSTRSDRTRSTQESELKADASEFCPASMPAKVLLSESDRARSSRLAGSVAHKSQMTSAQLQHEVPLSAAASEFVPQKLRSQSDSSEPESCLSAGAEEFVPRSLPASDKLVSV